MVSDDSVKNEDFYGSVKKNDKPARKRRHCPFCGNEMHSRIIGSYAFCDKCHRRMPWTVMKTDEKPIKPL